ncbi:uncharacterized protein A4U43_C09F120 [Asparagus officinalis]|uniref:XS domain-containing protein n=1 Tax=Asparagus officinalis TaxID=4686 RepID=A0A5P1E4J9_ASPOF|nr:uncharacterized protein LOC109823107 [Asparagus officinalis]ONK57399.1 uncharacterized protein A4U43_C09F120 [Asparagus officinalis]
MRVQRTEGVGRGRGRGNGRNRSPGPCRGKDHRSSYRKNPPLPHHPSRRSLSAHANRQRGPRRSPSPLTTRPRLSPARRSPPIEQHAERLYTMRRSEQHENRDWPNSFGDDSEHINFQHKYMLPEHPPDSADVHSLLKPSRTVKDKDLAGSSTSGVGNQGMLVQRSLLMDDGSQRTFYTLPQDLGHHPFESTTASLNPSSANARSIGSGSSLTVGMPRYDQRLGNLYHDKEREKLYSKDVSFSVMPPSRPFIGTSSSSFSKDTELPLNGDRDGGVGNFLDDPLEYDGYKPVQLSDRARWGPLSPRAKEETLDYGYEEPTQRVRHDHGYLPLDGPYNKKEYGFRSEFRSLNDSSFLDPSDGRADTYPKKFSKGSFWEQQHAVHEDVTMGLRDLKGVREDYVGSSGGGYAGFGPKASRDYCRPTFEESYRFGRDDGSLTYRKRPNSPLLADRPFGVNPPRERSRMDVDTFDLSPERILRRNHLMVNDMDGRNAHRRMQSPSDGDEMWTNEAYEPIEESRRVLHSKKRVAGPSDYRPLSRKPSRNDGWGVPRDSRGHMDGGHGTNLKKRLRPGPSNSHGSFTVERKQEYFRPHKNWKRDQEYKNINLNVRDEGVLVDAAHPMKCDPQEDSEEFKTQVHKAFLRFSKLLNESPHQQKRFRDNQGKSSKVLCCVCGSLSKEFSDVHSLLIHSYQTRKVGLRTEHLGFHKALCVLNGWNWLGS